MEKPVAQFGKVVMPEGKKVKNKSKTKKLKVTTNKKNSIHIEKIKDIRQLVFSCVFAYLCGGISVFGSFNPVGMACASAYFGRGAQFYFVCMAAFVGYAGLGAVYGTPIYIVSLCAAAVMDFFLEGRGIRHTAATNGLKGGACLVLGGISFLFLNGTSMFIVLRLIAEAASVFALTIMFDSGLEVFRSGIKNHVLSDDKFISAAAVVIIAVGALAGKKFFGLPIAVFMGTYIMLTAGFSAGAAVGCATGAVFAFCLIIMAGESTNLFMLFSIASLLGGAFNNRRILTVVSFFIGIIIPAFYLGCEVTQTMALGMIFAAAAFAATPEKVFDNINTFASHEKEFDCEEYFIRIKELTNKKLKDFAGAFGALAGVFDTEADVNEITPKGAGAIIDTVSAKVCENCSMSLYCWRTKSFEVYGAIQQLIGDIENGGGIDEKKLSPWLKSGCVRLPKLMEETLNCTKEYKNNMMWQNRLNESRGILKEQLKSVEKIVGDLGTQIVQMPKFNESLGKEIRTALLKKNIEVKKVFAVREDANGMRIYITKSCCFGNNQCKNVILPVVNRITGKHFVLEHDRCNADKNDNCTLILKENKGFVFETAVAKEVKAGSEKTGDTAFSGEYDTKKAVMALCDGMGSGEQAARESLRAIDLTKKFVKAGFDLSLTLKVLNSALATGNGEMYTTLDICSINLYTGDCEIIKNGGSTIFIVNENGIKPIRSSSLPVGVIREWNGEIFMQRLKSKDMVIMVTDGITDAFGVENEEKMVQAAVAKYGGNVDKIVTSVIEAAKRRTGGVAQDDMTIVAGRVI